MNKSRPVSLFGKLLLFFNVFVALGLLIIYLASRINPQLFWPIALPGLTYPFFFVLNAGFVLLWILRKRWWFLLSLLILLLGFQHMKNFVSLNSFNKPLPESGYNLKVLSYNVRVFDLYNYGPRWELNFTQRNNIFRFLQEGDFDIICFQEFVHDVTGAFKTLDTLPQILRARHAHADYSRSSRGLNYFGLATFSAWPILNTGRIVFPHRTGNMCIYTDILVGQDTLRVYNVHLASVGLSPEDFVFLENVISPEQVPDREYLRQGSKRILARLARAFGHRAEQVRLIAEHMDQCPYPIILAGDFNDTPFSNAYRVLTRNYRDAFRAGRGVGQTYNWSIPGFRIDYIIHSHEFKAYNFRTGRQDYSDHFPIWVWLNFSPETPQ